MIFEDSVEFATSLPAVGALAGLDLGGKRPSASQCPRAALCCDPPSRNRPTPQILARCRPSDRDRDGSLAHRARAWSAAQYGRFRRSALPIHPAFARNLTRLTDLPITFWDERLSTVAAERALLEADTSRKRRAEVIDHVAASYILQGLLDRLGHMKNE